MTSPRAGFARGWYGIGIAIAAAGLVQGRFVVVLFGCALLSLGAGLWEERTP